jgi:hypothetical protein
MDDTCHPRDLLWYIYMRDLSRVNVPTAGEQAFLMDYLQGEQVQCGLVGTND